MNTVHQAVAQDGLSPKVIASAITGLVVYLVTKLGLHLDPVVEQAINVGAMALAAYLAPAGRVAVAVRPVSVDPAAGNPVPPPPRRSKKS